MSVTIVTFIKKYTNRTIKNEKMPINNNFNGFVNTFFFCIRRMYEGGNNRQHSLLLNYFLGSRIRLFNLCCEFLQRNWRLLNFFCIRNSRRFWDMQYNIQLYFIGAILHKQQYSDLECKSYGGQ